MIGIRVVTPKPRKANWLARALAIGTITLALAFGPQQALGPTEADAHNTGYVGYGCSGVSGPPWNAQNDCYRGQETYSYPCYWLLIGHYGGWYSSQLQYQEWRALWCN